MLTAIIKAMTRGRLALAPSLESAFQPGAVIPPEGIAGNAPEPEEIKDDKYFMDNYAITLAEAQQEVEYLDRGGVLHKEQLGVVLDEHKECPIGAWVARAKTEGEQSGELDGGRKAVEKKLRLFGEMATEFTVVLDTSEYQAKKKLLARQNNKLNRNLFLAKQKS